ncbi:amidohydrolase family protein [Luethyella okanaganae]|uniref:Amidohydrolase family protein n=1 Tax=Luethyella okanaganae TaxID=69372 RepID=A0ABW1VIE6_9MICO
MEIVDAQVHLNMVGLQAGLVAMDAAGIDALVIDEFWGFDEHGRPLPNYPLSGGSVRHTSPLGEEAVARHPDRFAYVTRVQPDDPGLEEVIATVRERPGRLALRILPFVPKPPSAGESPENLAAVAAFAEELTGGRYDRYFALAERHSVPVFLQVNGIGIPGRLDAIEHIARHHPQLTVVIDHLGVAMPGSRAARPGRFAQFEEVATLARFPNVALKWGHATRLSEEPYPYQDVRTALHRIVEAFGAERIMWASDWTIDLDWSSWAESFSYIRDDEMLSQDDRAAILGGTVRRLLGWPASPAP